MLVTFGILIIISSLILGLIVLIQNPKGGGLSGTFGGFSNQFMGVKQTTDILEKGTWIFASVVALLCMVSPAFIPKSDTNAAGDDMLKKLPTKVQNQAPQPAPSAAPQNTAPMPSAPSGTQAPGGAPTPAPAPAPAPNSGN